MITPVATQFVAGAPAPGNPQKWDNHTEFANSKWEYDDGANCDSQYSTGALSRHFVGGSCNDTAGLKGFALETSDTGDCPDLRYSYNCAESYSRYATSAVIMDQPDEAGSVEYLVRSMMADQPQLADVSWCTLVACNMHAAEATALTEIAHSLPDNNTRRTATRSAVCGVTGLGLALRLFARQASAKRTIIS